MFTALSAGIAYGIGQAVIASKWGSSAAHGLSQGVVSTLRGGRFKGGFLSAFASHYIGESIRRTGALKTVVQEIDEDFMMRRKYLTIASAFLILSFAMPAYAGYGAGVIKRF